MSTSSEVRRELELLLRTRMPAVGLISWEETRVLKLVREVARVLSPARDVFTWSASAGLRQDGQPVPGVSPTCTMQEALAAVADHKGPAIFCLLDPTLHEPHLARAIRDLINSTGNQPRSLIFVGPELTLHPSLERSVARLEVPPPDQTELRNILNSVASRCVSVTGVEVQLSGDAPDRLVDAAKGLLAEEAERAFIRALLQAQRLSAAEVELVLREKRRSLEGLRLIEVMDTHERLEDLCGLENLQGWLERQKRAFSPEALASRLPVPKGMLLLGLSGCGRSAVISATAASWKLPLVRLRTPILQDKSPGLEAELRMTLLRLEQFAPLILSIPHLDRFFVAGSETEGGRAESPVAASLLQWLLEKNAAVFVAATAEEFERIPLGLLWKNGFDEVFFLDFPNSEERRKLLVSLLKRRGVAPQDINLEMLVAASDGFSGAQIEQAILRGMREAFEQQRSLRMVDILQSLRQMTPMAAFLVEARRKLKSWAHRRAVPASPPRDA
ncbi:MAG: AAA family ATPase [Myxococcota bacterium]